MEVYHMIHPHSLKKEDLPPSVMAMGFFDGIHLGHQKVIQTAKDIAKEKGIACSVMTFYPPPAVVLGQKDHPEYLTPTEHKKSLLSQMDIDQLFIVRFDDNIFSITPKEFVDDYIVDLNVQHAVAGFDFTYGHDREGTAEMLEKHAEGRFGVTIVDKVVENGEKISSTKIRELVRSGQTHQIPAYLGRYYAMNGKVVHGEKRGRTIGFPTANIEPAGEYLIPDSGVYAVQMKVDGKWLDGVASIGFKPQFHNNYGDVPAIEVYLFDFNGDLYGNDVTVNWYQRLRGQEKFESVDGLVEQMNRDVEQAKTYLQARKG